MMVYGVDIDLCYGRAVADYWYKASMSYVYAFFDVVKY